MWLDNASKLDMLFYKPYADLIKEIVEDEDYNPLTIGIFGLWGAGKSTLLNMIKDSIDTQNVECIEINAWMFEGYEDAKTAIMESLLQTIESNKKFTDKAGEEIKGLLKRVNWMKLGTKAVSFGAPLLTSIGMANPFPLLLNVATDVLSDKNKISETICNAANGLDNIRENYLNEKEKSTVENIRQFKNEFEKMLEKTGIKNLVVLIDDLDRCNPDRIIETLEAIKLFLSVKNTTFIIAADENVIQYAIKKKYPKEHNYDPEIAQEYIEKIIQLPIYIPELSSKDIENYLLLLVCQKYLSEGTFKKMLKNIYESKILIREETITLSELHVIISSIPDKKFKNNSDIEFEKDIDIINKIKDIIAYTLKGNPRQAKRFLNTFVTKRKLAENYFGDDIDIKILTKLLVLQKLDINLFKTLNEWNKNFTTKNEELQKLYIALEKDDLSEYKLWDTVQIRKWLKCEPTDLFTKRLDKYFYLTRELLVDKPSEQNIDAKTKELLEEIGNSKPHNIDNIVDRFSKIESGQIKEGFNILLPQIKEGKLELYIVKSIFIHFIDYRKSIINEIEEGEFIIELSDIPLYEAMYTADKENMKKCIESLKMKGRIQEKLYKMLIKGDE